MTFVFSLFIGAAALDVCPAAKGGLYGGGAWSAAVCYEPRPTPFNRPLVIA